MYKIGKRFTFSASHQLDHLPDEHKCQRLHGHNYTVEVVLGGFVLDERGFIMDYGELSDFGEMLDREYDHRHLNDVCGSAIATTAENLAYRFYRWLKGLGYPVYSVMVKETDKTFAEYSEGEEWLR